MSRQLRRLATVVAVSAAVSIVGAAHADSSPFPPSERWQAPTGGSEQLNSQHSTAPSFVSAAPADSSLFPPSERWQEPAVQTPVKGFAAPAASGRTLPGRVAIVLAHHAPEPVLDRSTADAAGERVLLGAGYGAFAPLYVGAHIPILLPFAVMAIPFTALAGGVIGGLTTLNVAPEQAPAVQAKAVPEPVALAVGDASLQHRFAAQVAAATAELPHYQFELRPVGAMERKAEPSYEALKAEGYDAVLELVVTGVGFNAWRDERRLEMTVQVRTVPFDGASAGTHRLSYRSAWLRLDDWVADGELFHRELDAASAAISLQLVDAATWRLAAE